MANRAHEYLVVVDVHAISSAQRTITLRLDREISTFNDLRSLVASRSGGVASFIVLRAVIHEYKSGEPKLIRDIMLGNNVFRTLNGLHLRYNGRKVTVVADDRREISRVKFDVDYQERTPNLPTLLSNKAAAFFGTEESSGLTSAGTLSGPRNAATSASNTKNPFCVGSLETLPKTDNFEGKSSTTTTVTAPSATSETPTHPQSRFNRQATINLGEIHHDSSSSSPPLVASPIAAAGDNINQTMVEAFRRSIFSEVLQRSLVRGAITLGSALVVRDEDTIQKSAAPSKSLSLFPFSFTKKTRESGSMKQQNLLTQVRPPVHQTLWAMVDFDRMYFCALRADAKVGEFSPSATRDQSSTKDGLSYDPTVSSLLAQPCSLGSIELDEYTEIRVMKRRRDEVGVKGVTEDWVTDSAGISGDGTLNNRWSGTVIAVVSHSGARPGIEPRGASRHRAFHALRVENQEAPESTAKGPDDDDDSSVAYGGVFSGQPPLLQRPKNGLVVATIELLSSSDKEEDKRLLDNWVAALTAGRAFIKQEEKGEEITEGMDGFTRSDPDSSLASPMVSLLDEDSLMADLEARIAATAKIEAGTEAKMLDVAIRSTDLSFQRASFRMRKNGESNDKQCLKVSLNDLKSSRSHVDMSLFGIEEEQDEDASQVSMVAKEREGLGERAISPPVESSILALMRYQPLRRAMLHRIQRMRVQSPEKVFAATNAEFSIQVETALNVTPAKNLFHLVRLIPAYRRSIRRGHAFPLMQRGNLTVIVSQQQRQRKKLIKFDEIEMSEKKGTSQLPMPAATTATNAATVAFPKPASSVLPPSMSSSLRRRSRTSSWGKAILSSLSTSKSKAPSDNVVDPGNVSALDRTGLHGRIERVEEASTGKREGEAASNGSTKTIDGHRGWAILRGAVRRSGNTAEDAWRRRVFSASEAAMAARPRFSCDELLAFVDSKVSGLSAKAKSSTTLSTGISMNVRADLLCSILAFIGYDNVALCAASLDALRDAENWWDGNCTAIRYEHPLSVPLITSPVVPSSPSRFEQVTRLRRNEASLWKEPHTTEAVPTGRLVLGVACRCVWRDNPIFADPISAAAHGIESAATNALASPTSLAVSLPSPASLSAPKIPPRTTNSWTENEQFNSLTSFMSVSSSHLCVLMDEVNGSARLPENRNGKLCFYTGDSADTSSDLSLNVDGEHTSDYGSINSSSSNSSASNVDDIGIGGARYSARSDTALHDSTYLERVLCFEEGVTLRPAAKPLNALVLSDRIGDLGVMVIVGGFGDAVEMPSAEASLLARDHFLAAIATIIATPRKRQHRDSNQQSMTMPAVPSSFGGTSRRVQSPVLEGRIKKLGGGRLQRWQERRFLLDLAGVTGGGEQALLYYDEATGGLRGTIPLATIDCASMGDGSSFTIVSRPVKDRKQQLEAQWQKASSTSSSQNVSPPDSTTRYAFASPTMIGGTARVWQLQAERRQEALDWVETIQHLISITRNRSSSSTLLRKQRPQHHHRNQGANQSAISLATPPPLPVSHLRQAQGARPSPFRYRGAQKAPGST